MFPYLQSVISANTVSGLQDHQPAFSTSTQAGHLLAVSAETLPDVPHPEMALSMKHIHIKKTMCDSIITMLLLLRYWAHTTAVATLQQKNYKLQFP